jgi:hypothetical protein
MKNQLIQNYYDDEDNESFNDAKTHKFTASAQVSDFTMLDAIASRFNTSRSALVSEILHENVLEMYMTLNKKDREHLSSIADLETTAILDKKGITQKTAGFDLPQGEVSTEDRTWRGYSSLIQRSKDSDNVNS